MLIPYQELSSDAVASLAKEWVVSNLSDVETQPNVEQWTLDTISKIKKGELVIEFGEDSQTVYLKAKDSLNLMSNNETSQNE